jgi:hypothetical protein
LPGPDAGAHLPVPSTLPEASGQKEKKGIFYLFVPTLKIIVTNMGY